MPFSLRKTGRARLATTQHHPHQPPSSSTPEPQKPDRKSIAVVPTTGKPAPALLDFGPRAAAGSSSARSSTFLDFAPLSLDFEEEEEKEAEPSRAQSKRQAEEEVGESAAFAGTSRSSSSRWWPELDETFTAAVARAEASARFQQRQNGWERDKAKDGDKQQKEGEQGLVSESSVTAAQDTMPSSKTSSESARSGTARERWAQRRLERLTTEHGFREQRQGTNASYHDSHHDTQGQSQQQQSPETASSTYSSASANAAAAADWEEPAPGPAASGSGSGLAGLSQQSQVQLLHSRAGRHHHDHHHQHHHHFISSSASASALRANTYPSPSSNSHAPASDSLSPHSGAGRQQSSQHHFQPRASSTRPDHQPFSPVHQHHQQRLQQQQQQYEHNPEQPSSRPSKASRSNNSHSPVPAPAADSPAPMSSSNHTNHGGSNSNSNSIGVSKTARSAGSVPAASSANRHSMHGLSAPQAAALAAQIAGQGAGGGAGAGGQGLNHSAVNAAKASGEGARGGTPQPVQSSEDMSPEEVTQLIKEHKELREKYTKVKKYYFEKEDQVKQLQNSLAHQRLSQSRTSLDDSEYSTRFNRLDGLVAQLAFGIRKEWRTVPPWLASSVNKDAVTLGKQEMTAVGRAVISNWLVEEVFDKYFHPDLDPSLSVQLHNIQKNIRRYAPLAHTAEEQEVITSKIVNWRLATLEGLQDALQSTHCASNRAKFTESLKDQLCNVLAVHLKDPTPPELEGGVHMIIELVVGIAIHLPMESRDVAIEYFSPGDPIEMNHMKLETAIPPLAVSIAESEDSADRASTPGGDADSTEVDAPAATMQTKKRGMFSALTSGGLGLGGGGSTNNNSNSNLTSNPSAGAGSGNPAKLQKAGPPASGSSQNQPHGKLASGSSTSLPRPDSAHGTKEQPSQQSQQQSQQAQQQSQRDQGPRVRIAAGVGVQIRGRSVLVKAPVFASM